MNIKHLIKHEASALMVNINSFADDERINKQISSEGCAVIYDFISSEKCLELIESAKKIIENNKSTVKIESNGSDCRVYRIDEIDSDFRLEEYARTINDWAKRFYRTSSLRYFQMLGNIKYKDGNLGSGSGWHRDSPFKHQIKFILYLTDVDEGNGPFQYITGTHKERNIYTYSKKLKIPLDKYRFTDEEINNIIEAMPEKKISTITGKAGTLLIADVKGLHRGMPLLSGERWATTRYYFDKKIPDHFN